MVPFHEQPVYLGALEFYVLPLLRLSFLPPVWMSLSFLVVADEVPEGEVAAPMTPAMLKALEAHLMERLAAVVQPPTAPMVPPGAGASGSGTSSSAAAAGSGEGTAGSDSDGTGGESGPGPEVLLGVCLVLFQGSLGALSYPRCVVLCVF